MSIVCKSDAVVGGCLASAFLHRRFPSPMQVLAGIIGAFPISSLLAATFPPNGHLSTSPATTCPAASR